MKEIIDISVESQNNLALTVFSVPNEISELTLCLINFILVVAVMLLLLSAWTDYKALKGIVVSKKEKILFLELITFSSLFIFYIGGNFCVILPLMFMLSILVLWYLVQVYAR